MEMLLPGSVVLWKAKRYIVEDLIGLEEAVVRRDTGTKQFVAPIAQLVRHDSLKSMRAIHGEDAEKRRDAAEVYKLLRPLLENEKQRNTIADVEGVAKQLGLSRSTVYDYIQRWRNAPKLSTLLRKERADKGKPRLVPAVAAIVHATISDYYATAERPSPTDTWEEVCLRCRNAGLPSPSKTTVVNYLAKHSARKLHAKRYGTRQARHKFEPYHGQFPGADFPLAVVQIDHTPMDVIVLDESRVPFARPLLTIVIDVCTRMIVGFCITMEKAGHLPAALALNHAMLPKDDFVKKHRLTRPWPIYGKPRKIFVDNAKEFRGTAMKRGCEEHDIILENRPKGLPQYGGHVEKAFGSFMRAVHRVPGTTFSNTVQKAKYDSKRRAILTLEECEAWFAIFIAYRYHHKRHKGIDYPPIKLYERHVLGDDEIPGIGLPAPLPDPDRLLWDFLQPFERTITTKGVEIERVHYFHDVLRPWIDARDPEKRREARKFTFIRDPRDISTIQFFDPDLREYFPIPYRDRTLPPISVWELRAMAAQLRNDPNRQTDEGALFEGIARERELLDSAAKATTKERQQQRRGKTATRMAKERAAKDEPNSESLDWADKPDDVPDFDVETI